MEQNNVQGQINTAQTAQSSVGTQPIETVGQPNVGQPAGSPQTTGGQSGFVSPQFSGDHEIIKSTGAHHGSYKIIVIIFLIIVIIAAVVYGVIMFKSGSGINPLTSLNAPPVPVISTPTSIPTPVVLSQEEQNVDVIDTGDPSTQLQNIDQDVQSL